MQSNRSFLAGCSHYWRTVLTAPQRAAWSTNPGPGATGFQRYMAWQKANEGLKMVNPRIDLWDTIPPFPVAPGAFSPPTISVSDTHLWLTAPDPGNDASYLQGVVLTDPSTQYVQVSVKPFRRSISVPKTVNTNYQLMLPNQLNLTEQYRVIRNFLGNSFLFDVRHQPKPPGSEVITWRANWAGPSAVGNLTDNTGSTWLKWNAPTYQVPAAGNFDIPFTIDYDQITTPSVNGTLFVQFVGQSYFQDWMVCPAGVLAWKPTVTQFQFTITSSFPTAITDLWEYPFHTMGAPHANFYAYVRLMPVDIATGSPGTPEFFLAAPE
ncbi:MAG: hypothetical protein Q8R28_04990 [Dehalococcoidia bacterium]|nr:hypothetical protein [Dehalococcoidia bacterium]